MFKKILTLQLIMLTTSCGVLGIKNPNHYEMSEIDVRNYLLQYSAQIGCLGIPRNQNEYLVQEKMKMEILDRIVGINNRINMVNNPVSRARFESSVKRLQMVLENENPALPITKESCNFMRETYQQNLNSVTVQQEQNAKEAEARQKFYATQEGQAYLAQQRIIHQQQQMRQQQYQQEEKNKTSQAWKNLANSIEQSSQSLTNNLNRTSQMYENATNQLRIQNQQMQGWGAKQGGTVNCYQYGNITRCNY